MLACALAVPKILGQVELEALPSASLQVPFVRWPATRSSEAGVDRSCATS
jgi:hypothetical protein